MYCWKCGKENADGLRACVYCSADQRRSELKTEAGKALRMLYDQYGAEKLLTDPLLLVNGIGDLVQDSKKLKNRFRMAMDARTGKQYLEQIRSSGGSDDAFESRIWKILTEDAGLSDVIAQELTEYFDEMIG